MSKSIIHMQGISDKLDSELGAGQLGKVEIMCDRLKARLIIK